MTWVVLTALLSLMPEGRGAAYADAGDVLRWDLVGHIADKPIAWLAAAPDHSAAGVLFARAVDTNNRYILNAQLGAGETRRSRDGGKTWEAVPDAPGRIVLPRGGAPAFSLAKDALYRSSDVGETWNIVLPGAANELLFSPGFPADGVVFAHAGDSLWRSTDSGATWSNLDPGSGQAVAAVWMSPAFASDQTLFVGAVSARPTGFGHSPPPTDNEDSLGLLESQDGGTTWTAISDGLQIDGAPYRQILAIAGSPSFAADQTLFVLSLGPWQVPDRPTSSCSACLSPRTAVFRSRDAGASWDSLNAQSFQPTFPNGGRLGISPGFATEQTLFDSLNVNGPAPSLAGCDLFISTDGGDSWQQARGQGQGAGLCGTWIVHAVDKTVIIAYQRPYYLSSAPNQNIEHSLDGGASWTRLTPPGDGPAAGFEEDLSQRLAIRADRVLQATQRGDLWAYGTFPPCAVQPMLGFGSVWTQHPDWQDAAGCPVEPEQPVAVQTRHEDVAGLGPTGGFWVTGGGICLRTFHDLAGQLRVGAGDQTECASPGDRTVQGSVLRFLNDQYWLFIADSPGHATVVSSTQSAALELTP